MVAHKYEKLLPHISLGTSIPKCIYQTFRQKEGLPEELQANIDELCLHNPNWEYHLYDDDDIIEFIQKEYGDQVLSYYQRISREYGAARADFFRYLLMYRCGGVYLDIKSSAILPLDDILMSEDRYILSHWDNEPGRRYEAFGRFKELSAILPRGEYQQWHIISVSGHPFLRAVILRVMENIDNYHPWKHGVGLYGTLRTTGPLAYTQAILACQKTLSTEMWRFVNHAELIGLEYSIYDRQGILRQHRNKITPYSANLSSVVVFPSSVYMKILKWGSKCLWILEILKDKWRQRKYKI
ncbi:MAG: hypothetical protein MR396_07930 [Phocaeicola sp.]|nr:hypothetical protein [Phocaeicola sp.]MDD7448460.1 glycosyltransferase [Prevotellaceae bacterium]MDY3914508.1 glycosyltransferase [Phocaeicola sp.]